MAHKVEMQQMQEFIAGALGRTGEFEKIEIGYSFPGADFLNQHKEGNIYAVRQSIDGDGLVPFLILTHTDIMPGKEFVGKSEEASERGIAVVHVLYRYLNDSGPFWRRRPIQDEREEEERVYRQKAAFRKEAFGHLPAYTRNGLRYLATDTERILIPSFSPGRVVNYYQPESARLDELLQRVRFNDVTADYRYSGYEIFYPVREAKKTKYPEVVEETKFFSLDRAKRGGYLVADIIPLPEVDAASSEEITVRHMIGRLAHNHPRFDPDSFETVAVRLYNCGLSDSKLGDVLNGLYPAAMPKEHAKSVYESHQIFHFYYKSRSRPGQGIEHQTAIDLTDPESPLESCTCEAFNYGLDCWHRGDARQRARNF